MVVEVTTAAIRESDLVWAIPLVLAVIGLAAFADLKRPRGSESQPGLGAAGVVIDVRNALRPAHPDSYWARRFDSGTDADRRAFNREVIVALVIAALCVLGLLLAVAAGVGNPRLIFLPLVVIGAVWIFARRGERPYRDTERD